MAEELTFTQIDRFIIYIYFITIVSLGIFHYWNRSDKEDFLIAGRKLSIGAFIATLVSTFYGGILGVGEFSYQFGLVSWFTQGFFYYIFAAFYAFVLAPKIRRNSQYTLPDQLYTQYNRSTGFIGSLFTFILVTPAPYVLMVGIMLQIMFGWSLVQAIIIGTLFSTIYVMFGGLRSVVRTDILQFVLMFTGFGLVLPFAWVKLGSLPEIISQLPPGHSTIIGKLGVQKIIAWFFIAAWTIVSPSFYQRCCAAKSESVAKKGILISIGFWFIFDMLTLSAGLYARYAFSAIDPVMAYPLLGQMVLPAGLKALFFIGMLATIMSSLDSAAFLSAITLGRDIIWRTFDREKNESNVPFYTRISLVASATLAVIIAVGFRSVIDIWYSLGSLAIPILFLPLLTSFFPKCKLNPKTVFAQMLATGIVSLCWMISGYLYAQNGQPSYPLGIAPMFPVFLISSLWWILAKKLIKVSFKVHD